MCGIWLMLGGAPIRVSCKCTSPAASPLDGCESLRDWALHHIGKLHARGPELTACVIAPAPSQAVFGFTRLAINGLTALGDQPFVRDGLATLVCNGEIYNSQQLHERHGIPKPLGASDCEVLPWMLHSLPPTDACNQLDGVFALAALASDGRSVIVARDPFGVRPLFTARLCTGAVVFTSEIKALPLAHVTAVAPFPPGCWKQFDAATGAELAGERYFTPAPPASVSDRAAARAGLRAALEAAVRKRVHLAERPIGALLSGGLDSSLIASLVARELRAHGAKLQTFSIGMPGSPDVAYARIVAEWIGSEHHEVMLTPADFLAAVPTVIRDIESYDITTVRASVGNWLIGQYIAANSDVKVVFNGDGSDEVGGGYLYMYRCPDDAAFEAETSRLLADIHAFDVLRSDRSVASHGLEARTPFLDKAVVAAWRAAAVPMRRPMTGVPDRAEKQLLREAFDDGVTLPKEVLWRRKEAFSDGVSSTEKSWYQMVSEHHAAGVAFDAAAMAAKYPHVPPRSAEALFYRTTFEQAYGAACAAVIPYVWMPRWSPETSDPSARTLAGLYTAAPEAAKS